MGDWKMIELYSDMESNELSSQKICGDIIKVDSKDAIKLIDILISNQVQFAVWDVGECLIDKSYSYWNY